MKNFKKTAAALLIASALLTSCKNNNENGQDVGSEVGNGENYVDEQEKSTATETGQHIGNDTDSTSVRDEPGKVSNN